MPQYSFHGVDDQGQGVTGKVEAPTQSEALREVRKAGYYTTEIWLTPSSANAETAPRDSAQDVVQDSHTPAQQVRNSDKDHIPYCYKCESHVSPLIDRAQKFCPHCGGMVWSNEELQRLIDAEKEFTVQELVFWIVGGITVLGFGLMLTLR